MNRQAISYLIKYNNALMLVSIMAMLLFGCKASGDLTPYNPPTNLNFINASADSLNLYQNGARLNNISTVSPGSQTGYISVASGLKTYQLKKSGASNYIVGDVQLTLDTSARYTLFAAGETADKVFLVQDIFPATPAGMSEVRFINASPSSTALDIYVGSVSFLNQAFKSAGSIKPVATGSTVITIYQHGATAALFSAIANLAGSNYTLYTSGIPGGTGFNQFSVTLSIN